MRDLLRSTRQDNAILQHRIGVGLFYPHLGAVGSEAIGHIWMKRQLERKENIRHVPRPRPQYESVANTQWIATASRMQGSVPIVQ